MSKTTQPSHLKIFFKTSRLMRREHISGAPAPKEGEGIMLVCREGTEALVERPVATDLVIAGTGIEVKRDGSNNHLIEDAKREIAERAEFAKTAEERERKARAAATSIADLQGEVAELRKLLKKSA